MVLDVDCAQKVLFYEKNLKAQMRLKFMDIMLRLEASSREILTGSGSCGLNSQKLELGSGSKKMWLVPPLEQTIPAAEDFNRSQEEEK